MKILVTGANGMLGNTLCLLYHIDHEVFAIHRDEHSLSKCSDDFSLDLNDLDQLQFVMNKVKPDLVLHTAGLTSIDKCEEDPKLAYEANVVVTENMARSCSNKTKLIYISTDQVYGAEDDRSELNMNLQPVNQYGKTKLQGEQKVQELCTDYIIIRTNIFGWNVKPKRISSAEWIYGSLKKKKEITLFTNYIFSPIYTTFLGDIIMQLVDLNFTGIINVGSSTPCSKYDFGIHMADEFELNSSLIRKGSISDHSFFAPRPQQLDLDVSKLYDLGLTPPDYRNSIKHFSQNMPDLIQNF